MFKWLGGLIDSNEKEIKRLQPIVNKINNLELEFQKLGEAKTNPRAEELKEHISLVASDIKETTSHIRLEFDTLNRQIQSASLIHERDTYKQEVIGKQVTIVDFIDKLNKTKTEVQSVKTDDFEERMAEAVKHVCELSESIIEDVGSVPNLLNRVISELSNSDVGQNDTTHLSGEKASLIDNIRKAKEWLVKTKLDQNFEQIIYSLEEILGSLVGIDYELKKFTIDNLKAKTYEFKDRIAKATDEIQNEIDTAKADLFEALSIIKVFDARDELVKALLSLRKIEIEEQLALAREDLNNFQSKNLQSEIQNAQQKVKRLDRLLSTISQLLDGENDIRILGYAELELELIRNELEEFDRSRNNDGIERESILHKLNESNKNIEVVKQQVQEYQKAVIDSKELPNTIKSLDGKKYDIEQEILSDILPEAFAAVREAARRTIGQRHYDVQLMGGVILHQGKIAEMKTGEGKTLVATLPLYLNALTGRGCHLVTVNDYLARRDPYWMGPIYHALGVKVASIYPMQTPDEMQPSRLFDPDYDSGDRTWPHFKKIPRQEAYLADITYGQSSEFGFDYLRDNMVVDLSQAVQRPLNFAIVDEVDNLLIDEARTPLIISGQREESLKEYEVLARIAPHLTRDTDYKMNEKGKGVDEITEEGFEHAEGMLRREGLLNNGSIYDEQNANLLHHLRNAIVAKEAYQQGKEYVVKDGEVIIVDEFTGRLMLGRRYEGGLHQAIEAKEHVLIQKETATYATITIQNYFRMYSKLGGMTGTAVTEAEEFSKIYNLEVVTIPTNKPMIREDFADKVYKTEKGKFKAVVEEIFELHKEGRPVLLGTASIEKSEVLDSLLKRNGIPHEVLNAKQHEREAGIIAQAGRPGAVTVATNMAGRGVDIILGGRPEGVDPKEWQAKHDEVVSLGGLHVIGTERHEARRIDNQLRGRAGRQGDPGSSRFYVSLKDDLMRRFGGERIKSIMEWAGMDEDTAIENSMVSKSLENSQVRVEGYHFDMRKHLVDYDDVINKQREIIYSERRRVLAGADLKANILTMVKAELTEIVEKHTHGENEFEPDYKGLLADANVIMPLPPNFSPEELAKMTPTEIADTLCQSAEELYEKREKDFGPDAMRLLERLVMLRTMDSLWIEHLTAMEGMREGVGLEAVAQHDPLVTYKTRGHAMFEELMAGIQGDLARTIFHMAIKREPAPTAFARPVASTSGTATAGVKANPGRPMTSPSPLAHVPQSPMAKVVANNPRSVISQPSRVAGKKVGRNDPCPCGSGKKYKHCCGR